MSSSPQKSASQAHAASSERVTERDAVVSSGFSSAVDAMHLLHGQAGNYAVAGALGGGMPLAADIRAEMEARFGVNFADVRIHNDAQAHASAALMDAKAYTYGNELSLM